MVNVGSAITPAQGNQSPGTLPVGNAPPPVTVGNQTGSGCAGPTATLSPQDNASGFSSVGRPLQANARLGSIWQDSVGQQSAPADTELVANLKTDQLQQLYGVQADTIHNLGKSD